MAFLELRDVDVYYGPVQALQRVNLDVNLAETVAVVGANGAGKSTLLKTVIGAVKQSTGAIRFDDRDIRSNSAPRRVASGMAMVPEGRQIFVSMTVEENLLVGASTRRGSDALRVDLDRIFDRFPNLAERRHMAARVLSGGEQQMLAIGRALMARPRLILLDEPSLGLSPAYVGRVYELLGELGKQGMAILLVEQNVSMALRIAARAYVLELGRVVLSGPSEKLLESEELQEAYLGRRRGSADC